MHPAINKPSATKANAFAVMAHPYDLVSRQTRRAIGQTLDSKVVVVT
jgi:hypothetical protein